MLGCKLHFTKLDIAKSGSPQFVHQTFLLWGLCAKPSCYEVLVSNSFMVHAEKLMDDK